MKITIEEFPNTEDTLFEVTEALEAIKNLVAEIVYDMDETAEAIDPLEKALESLDDAIDSINDAVDAIEEEELELDAEAEAEEEEDIEDGL